MTQTSHAFEKQIVKAIRLAYLLGLPDDYETHADGHFPLVLFLHGSGERGSDIEKVKTHGLPKHLAAGETFPFITLSPQCPEGSRWIFELDALAALLDEITARYRVDRQRIYLTGLSMGGFGAWELATQNPQRFAALVPVCGWGDADRVCAIKHLPVWVFHGDNDTVVPVSQSQQMVDALTQCGGNVKFTIYPDTDHDSWSATYANPELYTWMLAQRKA